ncbi:MAG: UDP-N-acetylmuramoyl-tripeptide--D-alanyl-D-alanine ligase [candidate division WOR-3 bacterium]
MSGGREPFSIVELVRVTGGRQTGNGPQFFSSVSIDTRTLKPGDVYFALHGKRVDGHQFVGDALRLGAAAVVVDQAEAVPNGALAIVVDNTTAALGRFAAAYRAKFDIPVFAVTGSNGKTTTKEMLAAILSHRLQTVAAPSSFNNDVGVPLTALKLNRETQAAVFELEMNEPGGTARLARICRPKYGVITNIGDTHLETMKDRTGVAQEKGELLQCLPRQGVAILNADDPAVMDQARKHWAGRILTFGLEQPADLWATDIQTTDITGVRFSILGRYPVALRVPGVHNVMNALAACAALVASGTSIEKALPGLDRFQPLPMRLTVRRLPQVTLIDDSYNANPQSMRAALAVLEGGASAGHRVAFLGEMLELGDAAPRLHEELGRELARVVDRGVLVGAMAEYVLRGAVTAGLSQDAFVLAPASDHLPDAAFDLVRPGDTILVKGSRATAMERVSQEICRRYAENNDKSFPEKF